MEKTVRILEQSALSTRKYIDKKSGQEKVMNAVTGAVLDGCERLDVSADWRTDAGYDDLS